MILDLNKYRASLPTIRSICATNFNNGKKPIDVGPQVAVALNFPVLAAYYFIAELFGSDAEVEAEIVFLRKFYGYTHVEGLRSSHE